MELKINISLNLYSRNMDYKNITNQQVKFIRSFKQKKFRQKYNKYTIEGTKLVLDLLNYNSSLIDFIVINADFNEIDLSEYNVTVYLASAKNLSSISQFKNASSILAVCNMDSGLELRENLKAGKYFYLEDLQDPGNVGTIFRTAHWFSFDGILLSENTVDVYNHKVIQSSMGSLFKIKHKYLSEDEFWALKPKKIGTAMHGTEIGDYSYPESYIIMLGNEGAGLKARTISACDEIITIPGNKDEQGESLNVAISAAIISYTTS